MSLLRQFFKSFLYVILCTLNWQVSCKYIYKNPNILLPIICCNFYDFTFLIFFVTIFLLHRIGKNLPYSLLLWSFTRSACILRLTFCTHVTNLSFRTCRRHTHPTPGSPRSLMPDSTEEWTKKHWRYMYYE